MAEANARELDSLLDGTPYRAVKRLGGGGMGEIYEAVERGGEQLVVVKLLRAELSGQADLLDRMRLEGEVLALFCHPNIVAARGSGKTRSGRSYLAMEQLKGRTLRYEMKKRGVMPLDRALDALIQLLSALQEVHRAGIVHRDVKPENIMICPARRGSIVKLLDFGIAKAVGDPPVAPLAHPTLQGACVGTPRYAAPEQIRGGVVDGRVDIYAAGIVLYMLVAGRGPFDAVKDPRRVLEAHLNVPPEPPSRFAPVPIPPALDAAVMRAIAKRPDDRFAGAASFQRELALVLGRLCIAVGPWLEGAGEPPSIPRRGADAARGLPTTRVDRKVAPAPAERPDNPGLAAEIAADARGRPSRGLQKARGRATQACRRDGTCWAAPAPRLPGPKKARPPGAVSGVQVILSAAAFAAAASSLAMWFVR